MDEEKVSRGEIRLISVNGVRLPAVVVSSNEYNDKQMSVIAALIGSAKGDSDCQIRIDIFDTHGFMNCDNLVRVTNRSVGRCVGVLPRELMRRIDDVLEDTFDLGYEDDSKQAEIDALKSKVARLEREVEYGREGIMSRNTEIARYKTLYEKAVDQIADMTLATDIAKRIAEKTVVVEPKQAEEMVLEVVAPVEEEFFEEPPKEQPKLTFPTWEPPVGKPKTQEPVKKVNVNTATMEELMKIGFNKPGAAKIVAHRKKYGPYKKVEDLKNLDDVSSKLIRKLKDVLEV